MKAFQLSDPNIIHFQNLERIPGDQELENLKREIRAAGGKIGKKKEAGLDDLYECSIKGMRFDIIFDGAEATLYAPEKETIERLMSMFV